ncbi:hypothetical protein FJY63_14590 [Candidatus Sumerlaeota bacterium]|nr:hypothetical protein [Candidatus Sumerlaeota bacterium]
MISRKSVADKIAAYLHHEIALSELVDWAERALMDEELEQQSLTDLRDVVARLGLADVRAFGLTWENCEQMLRKLGYAARVDIMMAESLSSSDR